jgi:hypothetical protein
MRTQIISDQPIETDSMSLPPELANGRILVQHHSRREGERWASGISNWLGSVSTLLAVCLCLLLLGIQALATTVTWPGQILA